VLLLAMLAPLLAGADADPQALDRLMALLAQRQHGVADFEETQYLAMLKRPARSSGVLSYEAPDHLEQRTLKPHPQQVVLDHGMLTLQVGSHRRSVRLQDYPQIAPLIDSVRATLAGDRPALEQRFELNFDGDLDHWQLLLRPLEPQLAAIVARIRLAGERDAILQVEVRQSDGDRSLMRITPRE
jgi:hypothetical protein